MYKSNRRIIIMPAALGLLGICLLFITPLSHAADDKASAKNKKFEKFVCL